MLMAEVGHVITLYDISFFFFLVCYLSNNKAIDPVFLGICAEVNGA